MRVRVRARARERDRVRVSARARGVAEPAHLLPDHRPIPNLTLTLSVPNLSLT